MKYTGTTYRPPVEHDSLLLQVTVGCAHNKCTFCNMYRDVDFEIETIEQIENDLKKAKTMYRNVKRVFLLNGDAFVLSADRLREISKKITQYFPEVETITMYSSVHDIISKSDADLKDLRDNYRINDLYIGLETGHQETLKNIKKGHNLDDAIRELARLDRANIDYIALFMLGIAGKGKGHENAIASSSLINSINPKAIWFGTLGVYDESPLGKALKDGKFTLAPEIEILNEEKEIISLIELKDIAFYGVHPTNLASVHGILPDDRDSMIREIDDFIESMDINILNKAIKRTSL